MKHNSYIYFTDRMCSLFDVILMSGGFGLGQFSIVAYRIPKGYYYSFELRKHNIE